MDTRKLYSRAGSGPHNQAQISQEDGDGRTVAITYNDEGGSTAAELVRRWNAYPELVEALEAVMEAMEWEDSNGLEQAAYDQARAAIAKATGG